MDKPLNKLKFNPVAKRKRASIAQKKISKLVYCVCTQSEDGVFKANLRIISNTKRVTNWCIDFTPKSYSLTDKIRVFTIKPDKMGKIVCYIRTPWQAKIAPRRSTLYTPFCKDWVYSGHIVKAGRLMYFDIKEAIWHKDFVKVDLDIKESDMKL